MATSSIFHTVKIDTKEKAARFVAALEASEKAEQEAAKHHRPKRVKVRYVSDPKEIREMMRRRRESRK